MKTKYGPDCPLLPLAPWRAWLEEQVRVLGPNELAHRLGIDQRVLFRWRVEGQLVRLDMVDECLCRFGRPDLFNDLYPVECDDALLEEAA
jgi:hypothetical protein